METLKIPLQSRLTEAHDFIPNVVSAGSKDVVFSPRILIHDALEVERQTVGESRGKLRKRIKDNLDYLSFFGQLVKDSAPGASVLLEFEGSIFSVVDKTVAVVIVDDQEAKELKITRGLIDEIDNGGPLDRHPIAALGKVSKEVLTECVLKCLA